MIAAVSGLLMLGAGAAVMALPASYQASSAVIFQGDRPSAVRGEDALRDASFAPDTLANEIELMLSEEGALSSVVTRLDLVHDPEYAPKPASGLALRLEALIPQLPERWRPAAERLLGRTTDDDAADRPGREVAETVTALRSRLSVNPVGVSRVIRIVAQSRDPETATRIANAVPEAYLDALTSAKTVAVAAAHQWIEQRVSELRDRASRSALAYEEFRHANGLVRGKDSTISQEQITQISIDLTKARQARLETERSVGDGRQLWAELDHQLAQRPGIVARLREQAGDRDRAAGRAAGDRRRADAGRVVDAGAGCGPDPFDHARAGADPPDPAKKASVASPPSSGWS